MHAAAIGAIVIGASAPDGGESSAATMPHYDHIFVIVSENKGHDQLMSHPEWTPVIHKLADEYGSASQFYAEVHSSEANYIAMLGGDTFTASTTTTRSSATRASAIRSARTARRPITPITI